MSRLAANSDHPAARSSSSSANRVDQLSGQNRVAAGRDLNTDFMLETIIYDFLWSALHVGILATLLNAWTRPNEDWSIRPWHHILHDSDKIMQLALRYGPEMGISDAVRVRLLAFYDDVAAGMRQIAPFMKASASQSSTERGHLLNVCSAWRRIAQETKSTLALVEGEVISRLGGVLHDDSRTLFEFLREAAVGDSKRVDTCGRIVLPNLKQMRRTPRLRIAGSCTIELGDRSIPARLIDLSVDGLGIACNEALPSDQSITVVLDDGRGLKCRFVRREGDRVGLAFEAPLQNDDPLFRRR